MVMPKVFTSKKQKIGEIGENIACLYLEKQGHKIIERNYTKKWGEIDIISSEKVGNRTVLHFIEVKSRSVFDIENVSRVTNPADNIDFKKIKKFKRIIETYLIDRHVPREMHFIIDIMLVYVDLVKKKGKVSVLKDIVL